MRRVDHELAAHHLLLLEPVGHRVVGGGQRFDLGRAGLQIEPLWWSLALGACLGGNGTLIGASANLTVAGLAERQGVPFKFMAYTKVAFPLMLMSILLAQGYLYFRFL